MHKKDCIRYINCNNYYTNLEPSLPFDCSNCKFYAPGGKQ